MIENKMEETNDEPSAVPKPVETPRKPPAKKRGRPGKNNKEWLEEEIFMLINLWSTKEELFNCRDEKYQNRDNRFKAINSIRDALVAAEFEVDHRQIQEKMTNLRNYFAAELRKIEASKKSGAGSGSVYKSTWKFFPHLQFLMDNFIPRPTSSNLPTPPDQEVQNTPYPVSNEPSAKAAKKMKELQKGAAEKVMETAARALERISERKDKVNTQEKTEDRCFVELLHKMLVEIPDCQEKAMAMLQIQQIVVSLRYRNTNRQSAAAAHPIYGQTYSPHIYNQRNQTPSPASVASVSSEPPMNSGMYQRMVNEEEQW